MGLIRVLATKLSKYIDRYLKRPFKDPEKTQEEFFRDLIKRNQKTTFGKRHKFSQIHSIRKFQENCPIYNYDYFEPYIKLILEGNTNVLSVAKQVYWGQTSGTAGTPKLIPIVNNTFKTVNFSNFAILVAYINEDPRNNSRFLDGRSCHFGAYPILRYEGKLPVGYGTGLFSYPRGGTQVWKYFTKQRLYIPFHLFRIKDIEKRYFQLTKEVIHKDFRQFSGVPSVITNTFEKILENCSKLGVRANTISEIFPNYHLTLCGGVSPKFYEKKLYTLIGRKIDFREQLSATEGVLGIQLQETPGFTPMVNANFFEFIPVDNPTDRCIINEIKKNTEYYICISAYNGLYAYNMGDIIKFISEDPPLFIFSSRKGVVNLVDEKLSHKEILYAIDHTNQEFDVILTDFTVIGLRTPHFHYLFILEFSDKTIPSSFSDYLKTLEKYLYEANDVYRYFRQDIGILKAPKLWVLHTGSYNEVLETKTKKGAPLEQTKIPHLTDKAEYKKAFEEKVKNEVEI